MSSEETEKEARYAELAVLARQAGVAIPDSSREAVLMHLEIAARMRATLDEEEGGFTYPELVLATVFEPRSSDEEPL